MDCDTTSAVERCYFRAEDVPTMATKIQQDRFELYGSQPYSNYFNFSWQPHVYDETAARNELDRPENSAARQWINHELNNTYPDPRRPQLVAPPSLVGSFFELETVSVTFGSWNPDQTQRTEQWQRCDSYGGLCSDIVGATGPLYSITSADVGHTLRIHELVSNAYGTADAYSAISPIVGSLLKRYTPELHYDSQESYRADSVAEITDNYIAGYQPTYENTLRDRDLGLLAGAGPNTNPHLSLDYLGTDATWSDDHFIDEQDNYAADAARLHSDPVYKNEAFGRQWTSPNGTKILQYWFFYYYNPKSWFQTGAGVHEGDWEMIQIQIDPAGNPTDTVYSQHDAAEVCDWGRSSHTSDGRPIVYVAEGSHANYYDPGSHDVAPGFVDTNDGFGGSVTPDLIDISSEPPWVGWRGTYGASDRSPHGPAQHSQWTDPIGWAAQQRGCSLLNLRFAKDSHSDAPRSKLPSPPAPQLRARIVGRSVVIEYDFRSFPVDRARRPWQLLTSVIGINGFPATTRTPLVSRQGRVQVALEHRTTRRQGLLISVLSRLGTRSRVIRLDVR